jgi:hypothetical protein
MPHPDTAAPLRLSDLFIDPFLRDAFRRAERGGGGVFAVPGPCPGQLSGGAAVAPSHEASAAIELCRQPARA